jgi:hypothetical protein
LELLNFPQNKRDEIDFEAPGPEAAMDESEIGDAMGDLAAEGWKISGGNSAVPLGEMEILEDEEIIAPAKPTVG